jgi:flagellar protein FliO/FliZ
VTTTPQAQTATANAAATGNPNPTATPTATPTAIATATTAATISLPAHPAVLASALPSLALPAFFLAALAVAAVVLGRRRRAAPRLVQVIEQTSLGPKRALVLARLGEEMLLLGSSEAGIALLKSQPAPAEAGLPRPAAAPAPGAIASVVARLKPARRAAAPGQAGFEDLLAESAEDQELRRKIAAGRAGSVR